MNTVYKIVIDDFDEEPENNDWHVMGFGGDTERILCNGQAIDGSADCVVQTKEVSRGGITCKECLMGVKYYKKFKL